MFVAGCTFQVSGFTILQPARPDEVRSDGQLETCNKKAPACAGAFEFDYGEHHRTASFSVFPALKEGTFIAGMEIFCDGLRGLTPIRAARWLKRKVPNPVIVTGVPFLRFLITRLMIA
jgi:hypothetical protein